MNEFTVLDRPTLSDQVVPLSTVAWMVLVLVLAVLILIDRWEDSDTSTEPVASKGEKRSVPLPSRTVPTPLTHDNEQEENRIPYTDVDVHEDAGTFARRLGQLREAVVASGQHLLSWEDLDREIADRRGDAA